jgi:hypothetical protein
LLVKVEHVYIPEEVAVQAWYTGISISPE